MSPFLSARPTDSDAPRSAVRSGWFERSIGVGTVTMKKSAAFRRAGSTVMSIFAALRFSRSISRVRS